VALIDPYRGDLLLNRFTTVLPIVTFLAVAPQLAVAAEVWTATDIRTAIDLYPEVLRDLGIEVINLKTSTAPVRQHELSVLEEGAPAFLAAQPWSMSFTTQNGHFEGFMSGTARHQGGFDLAWKRGGVSLQGFSIRAGREARTLEIVNKNNQVVLHGSHLHWVVDADAGLLEMFNVDLRLSKWLADRLGREALEGVAVGTLSLTAKVDVPEIQAAEQRPETGVIPDCNDWSGDQDVALINIGSVQQRDRSNGEVVIVPSATLKNVGTANVPWYSQFSGFNPPYNNDQHPFLTWSAFRVDDRGIKQLGVSDIKHAFLTLNFNCESGACTDGHILGIGCEDVYGTGTNSSNWDLSFREEILAAPGIWAHCNEPEPGTASHFDPNGDCSNGDFSPAGETYFTHGLVVPESALSDNTASYYFSAWYLIRDDIDIFNTMGYRQINPVFGSSSWTFGFLTSLTTGSPVDAWIPSGTNEPARGNEVLALGLGKGHLQLAVNVTDLGDGYFRYDYALMNHDFDQGLDGFSVPLGSGVSVRSTSFADIDQVPGNDWTVMVGSDSVSWTMPDPGSFQPWGVLFNFSLEANSGPSVANGVMDVAGDYRPETLEISTRAPSSTAIFADGFESGNTSAWSSTL
jgi:hypothetical protein